MDGWLASHRTAALASWPPCSHRPPCAPWTAREQQLHGCPAHPRLPRTCFCSQERFPPGAELLLHIDELQAAAAAVAGGGEGEEGGGEGVALLPPPRELMAAEAMDEDEVGQEEREPSPSGPQQSTLVPQCAVIGGALARAEPETSTNQGGEVAAPGGGGGWADGAGGGDANSSREPTKQYLVG